MNPSVARGLLVLLSCALVFGIAEAGFRMLPASGDSLRGLHQSAADSPWLYELKPNARTQLQSSGTIVYQVNPAGYRGPVAQREKPDAALRILVLGDSVAFGYGVAEDETFARRLQGGGAGSGALEVLNFGVGGYNPYNEAALFLGKGVAYQPDIVLVQFCINDLNDPTAHFDAQTRLELGGIPDAAFPNPAERRPDPVQASCWRDPCGCSRICEGAAATVARWRGSEPPLDLAALAPRQLPPGPSRRWIGDRYQEIASASQQIGARFAVVVFPYRDQVESGATAVVQEQLAALGRQRGFAVLDLLPAFQAAQAAAQARPQASRKPLFLDLWHPTAAGHRVAADAIRVSLESRGWMPVQD